MDAEFFLPVSTLRTLSAAQRKEDAARANELAEELIVTIERSRHLVVEVPNEAGARRMASASFLSIETQLLREVRDARRARSLSALGLRTIFELNVVGRYLLTGQGAEDEFGRRYNESLSTDDKLATASGVTSAPPVEFLQSIVSPNPKKPRDLRALCIELDKHDERDPADTYSLESMYLTYYKWLSSTATHANISAIKRQTQFRDGILALTADVPPIFKVPPYLVMVAIVREHATDLFAAVGLDIDLPHEIQRPPAKADPDSGLAFGPDGELQA